MAPEYELELMATSSAESCGCKHQAKNGHAKGEQTQSHLPSNSVRVARKRVHAKMMNLSLARLDNPKKRVNR